MASSKVVLPAAGLAISTAYCPGEFQGNARQRKRARADRESESDIMPSTPCPFAQAGEGRSVKSTPFPRQTNIRATISTTRAPSPSPAIRRGGLDVAYAQLQKHGGGQHLGPHPGGPGKRPKWARIRPTRGPSQRARGEQAAAGFGETPPSKRPAAAAPRVSATLLRSGGLIWSKVTRKVRTGKGAGHG